MWRYRGERDCIGEEDMICNIGLATFRYMVNTQKNMYKFYMLFSTKINCVVWFPSLNNAAPGCNFLFG